MAGSRHPRGSSVLHLHRRRQLRPAPDRAIGQWEIAGKLLEPACNCIYLIVDPMVGGVDCSVSGAAVRRSIRKMHRTAGIRRV
jgi:hypothetical protein